MVRRSLESELVKRGLVSSVADAAILLAENRVKVDGSIVAKGSYKVAPYQNIVLIDDKPKFVSRSGYKLEGALHQFEVNPAGLVCLDAGSSTGGFTDCLLQTGADLVYAVDVGTNQLHESLRNHERVKAYEQTDIRKFKEALGECDLVVADLAFISLKSVLSELASFLKPPGHLIVLVKPQFEATKAEASKGNGVISDPNIWRRVLYEVANTALSVGLEALDVAPSRIQGTHGNIEFVMLLSKSVNESFTSI